MYGVIEEIRIIFGYFLSNYNKYFLMFLDKLLDIGGYNVFNKYGKSCLWELIISFDFGEVILGISLINVYY